MSLSIVVSANSPGKLYLVRSTVGTVPGSACGAYISNSAFGVCPRPVDYKYWSRDNDDDMIAYQVDYIIMVFEKKKETGDNTSRFLNNLIR